MIILPQLIEDSETDAGHRTTGVQPFVSHRDTPGTDPMALVPSEAHARPAPQIGGQASDRRQFGWSTGLQKRYKRFTGAVIIAPAQRNPVQGNVGNNNRSAALYQGVMNQLMQYNPSQAAYAASYVGQINPTTYIVPGT